MYDHDRIGLNFGHHSGSTTVHIYRACEDCRADVTIGYGDRNKSSERLPEQGSRGFLVGESQTISFVENSYRTPKVVGGYGYAPYQRPSSTQVMIDGASGFMGEATGESKRTWTKAATRLGNGEVRYNLLGVIRCRLS